MKKNELRGSASKDEQDQEYFKESKKEPMNIKTRLVLGIASAVLVCALGLALPTLLDAIDPSVPSETQPVAGSEPSSAETPVAHATASGMLSVTAYAAEWKETVLKPGVSVALNEYSPAQSDVPGFPFIISVPEGNTDINTDGIRIDVDTGAIITWEPPDYTVRERGKTYILSDGDTIYWSPLDGQDEAILRCEMTVTGYTGEEEAYTQKIIISQTEDFEYTAELTDN
jgi:hypothetical protein